MRVRGFGLGSYGVGFAGSRDHGGCARKTMVLAPKRPGWFQSKDHGGSRATTMVVAYQPPWSFTANHHGLSPAATPTLAEGEGFLVFLSVRHSPLDTESCMTIRCHQSNMTLPVPASAVSTSRRLHHPRLRQHHVRVLTAKLPEGTYLSIVVAVPVDEPFLL